jgi:predicted GNAT family acetyltransferase
VAAHITSTGRTPFLHTGGTNTTAIRRYKSLGFALSNEMKVTIVEAI